MRFRATTRLAACCVAMVALLLASCGGGRESDGPPELAVSIPIFADTVGRIAGDRFTVWPVAPPGTDPHTYEATPRDIVRMTKSAGFIFMGASNEAFIESGGWRRAARDSGMPQLEYAQVVDLIEVDRIIDHGDHVHDLRDGDPHIWLDPMKVIETIDPTVAFLASIDPEGADVFRVNGEQLRTDLLALDAELEAGLAVIPPERRKLVVFHNAYTYFAARYGFEVVEYVIKAPGSEPSAREIAAIHQTIREAGINAVFAEPQFDARILERIAEDRGIRVGLLLTDTFTDDVEDYFALMRHNMRELVRHLAPE